MRAWQPVPAASRPSFQGAHDGALVGLGRVVRVRGMRCRHGARRCLRCARENNPCRGMSGHRRRRRGVSDVRRRRRGVGGRRAVRRRDRAGMLGGKPHIPHSQRARRPRRAGWPRCRASRPRRHPLHGGAFAGNRRMRSDRVRPQLRCRRPRGASRPGHTQAFVGGRDAHGTVSGAVACVCAPLRRMRRRKGACSRATCGLPTSRSSRRRRCRRLRPSACARARRPAPQRRWRRRTAGRSRWRPERARLRPT